MSINANEKEAIFNFITDHQLKIDHHLGWKNFSKNINQQTVLVLDIQDIYSLKNLIKFVYDLNQKKNETERIILRPAAGGICNDNHSQSYSFTAGSEGDVVIRLVGDEFRQIKTTYLENVMRVGASLQVGDLNEQLYHEYNLVLPTVSLIPYVTVAGLAANAGHGTGRRQPSFAGLIVAMTIMLPNGEIVRIDQSDPFFETIRGANLGLFGIVLDVELQCAEAKKLQCVIETRSLPELINEIKQGLFLNDPYVSVMYVPTYHPDELTNKNVNNVIIYRWRPVDKTRKDIDNHSAISKIIQEWQVDLSEELHVTDLLRHCPSLIPFFTRYLVSRLQIGTKDKISIIPWYNFHYLTSYPWDIDDADYLFEVKRNGEEVITAIEKTVSTLTNYAKDNKYPLTHAIYLRFLNGTNGGLSTSVHADGNYVCGIDMVSSHNIKGYREFKEEMKNYFIHGPLKAKPHWGKFVPEEDYREIYGEQFDEFKKTLKSWYKTHHLEIKKSMLLNEFFCDILQIENKPKRNIEHSIGLTFPPIFGQHIKLAEIANNVLPSIQRTDENADNLKINLSLISEAKLSLAQHTLFEKAAVKLEEKINKKKCKAKQCCNIL